MGTFGYRSFDNDTGLDLVDDCESAGTAPLYAALTVCADTPRETYLEVDAGAGAMASAELVAICHGRAEAGPDPDLAEHALSHANAVKDVAQLPGQPLRAIERATGPNSELHELWVEARPDESNAWLSQVQDLHSRLTAIGG